MIATILPEAVGEALHIKHVKAAWKRSGLSEEGFEEAIKDLPDGEVYNCRSNYPVLARKEITSSAVLEEIKVWKETVDKRKSIKLLFKEAEGEKKKAGKLGTVSKAAFPKKKEAHPGRAHPKQLMRSYPSLIVQKDDGTSSSEAFSEQDDDDDWADANPFGDPSSDLKPVSVRAPGRRKRTSSSVPQDHRPQLLRRRFPGRVSDSSKDETSSSDDAVTSHASSVTDTTTSWGDSSDDDNDTTPGEEDDKPRDETHPMEANKDVNSTSKEAAEKHNSPQQRVFSRRRKRLLQYFAAQEVCTAHLCTTMDDEVC